MNDEHSNKQQGNRLAHGERDRIIQVLSLEYQTLREDILVRASGRFQFLGLMTTAAALLATGVFSRFPFAGHTWISVTLAIAVFGFGLTCFLLLGRQMVNVSARVASIEARINALLPSEAGSPPLLSWESDRQRRGYWAKLTLGTIARSTES